MIWITGLTKSLSNVPDRISHNSVWWCGGAWDELLSSTRVLVCKLKAMCLRIRWFHFLFQSLCRRGQWATRVVIHCGRSLSQKKLTLFTCTSLRLILVHLVKVPSTLVARNFRSSFVQASQHTAMTINRPLAATFRAHCNNSDPLLWPLSSIDDHGRLGLEKWQTGIG